MPFEIKEGKIRAEHELEELKLVYRVLHQNLREHLDLMDTNFLQQLQHFLHERAREEGVDASDHGQWDRWLGNNDAPPCDVRVSRRTTLRNK